LFAKYESVCFVRVNIDVEKEIAEKFEVLGLPTVVVIKKGTEVKRYSGVPRDLASDLAHTVKKLSQRVGLSEKVLQLLQKPLLL
jgi:thioredoxin 1